MHPILAEVVDYRSGKEPSTMKITLVTNEIDNLTAGELVSLKGKIVKVVLEEQPEIIG